MGPPFPVLPGFHQRLRALALALTSLVAVTAQGEESAPVHPWSGSVGLFSQYVSRGVSYTAEDPALQAGIQFSHPTGWYLGLWGSNVSNAFIHGGNVESDPYGGLIWNEGPVQFDLGFWRWTFLGASLPVSRQKYDTVELYLGVTWDVLSVKYWQEVTDYFGVNDRSARVDGGYAPQGSTRGSRYLEANLALDLSHGLTFGVHAARQWVENYPQLDFSDYRIGLDSDLGKGWVVGAAYSDTTANPLAYQDLRGLNAARGKLVVSLKTTF